MKKLFSILLVTFLLTSCFKGGSTPDVNYLDEALPNEFDTVIKAHHEQIAQSIRDYIQDVYGTTKSAGTSETSVSIQGEGVDIVFQADGNSQADLSDLSNPVSQSDLDIHLVFSGDNPVFPTKVDFDLGGKLGLITQGQKAFFKISNALVNMNDQPDIASQMNSMIQLFSDKWIVMDPAQNPDYDPNTTDLAQNLPQVLEILADELPNYPIFSLVESKPQEDDYYVYSVSIDEENIASLVVKVSQELNPEMTQEDADALKQEVIDNIDFQDLVGDLKIHSRAPQLWSYLATASGEDGAQGTLDVANMQDTSHLYVTESKDNVQIKINVEKGDKDNGTASVSVDGELMLFGNFTLDYEDMNGTVTADVDVYNIPNLTQPLKILFSSTTQSQEDLSVNIQIPTDAINASDLGLGLGAPSVSVGAAPAYEEDMLPVVVTE